MAAPRSKEPYRGSKRGHRWRDQAGSFCATWRVAPSPVRRKTEATQRAPRHREENRRHVSRRSEARSPRSVYRALTGWNPVRRTFLVAAIGAMRLRDGSARGYRRSDGVEGVSADGQKAEYFDAIVLPQIRAYLEMASMREKQVMISGRCYRERS